MRRVICLKWEGVQGIRSMLALLEAMQEKVTKGKNENWCGVSKGDGREGWPLYSMVATGSVVVRVCDGEGDVGKRVWG